MVRVWYVYIMIQAVRQQEIGTMWGSLDFLQNSLATQITEKVVFTNDESREIRLEQPP